MKRTRHRKNAPVPAKRQQADDERYYNHYEITDAPLKSDEEKFSKAAQAEMDVIFELLTTVPQQAIEKLLVLKKAYPNSPRLYNYLSAAYAGTGNIKAAREWVIENYDKNPDYLFAKINYAQLCLDKGEFDKIPVIFDNKFDLKMLYPNRNTFHITEFAGFTGVMCAYYWSIGERGNARLLFDLLKKVAPESSMVKYAQSFLSPSWIAKLFRLMHKKQKQPRHKMDAQKKERTWL